MTIKRLAVLCLVLGCKEELSKRPPSHEEAAPLPLCPSEEETEGALNPAVFTRAVTHAYQELMREGVVIDGSVWADPERYFLFADRTAEKLGCRLEGAPTERRHFGAECSAGVDLSRGYDHGTVYCGGGAGPTTSVHCRRLSTGDCMNEVCYDHDLCYEHLVAEQGNVCLWSPATESCDSRFHGGALLCRLELRCGFRCQLIAAIAAAINLIQDDGTLVGRDCIWGSDERMRADAGVATSRRDATVPQPQPVPTPDAPLEEARLDGGSSPDVSPVVPDTSVARLDAGVALDTGPTCTAEICDGLDNDCDRQVDEDWWNVGDECFVGRGDCQGRGNMVCAPDGRSVVCDAVESSPSDEVCDGRDNDCDGYMDNPGEDLCISDDPCAVGICSAWARTCIFTHPFDIDGDGYSRTGCALPIDCNDYDASVSPSATEVCNGRDDNCNGEVDELPECCPTTPCGTGEWCCSGICLRDVECCPGTACEAWNGSGYVWTPCSPWGECAASCTTNEECETSRLGSPDVCCGGLCYPGDCCDSSDCWPGLTCSYRWGVRNCNVP